MKLGIIGNSARGRDVINFLLMMGGRNIHNYYGNDKQYVYFIDDNNFIKVIAWTSLESNHDYSIYSFDLLEKTFPYKINEDVWFIIGDNVKKGTIKSMSYEGNTMVYNLERHGKTFLASNDELRKITDNSLIVNNKESETILSSNNDNKTISIKDIRYQKMEVLVDDKLELIIEDGKPFLIKKPLPYPNEFKHCAKILGIFDNDDIMEYEYDKFEVFKELIICRNAFWKLANDWKPDWSMYTDKKYCIKYSQNEIKKCEFVTESKILAFPTKEMRDTFYEYFYKIIELCKDFI